MVDKNELRAAFSARLHEALNDAGIRARGRGVDVHRGLKDFGVTKTTQAVSKWLNGESVPEPDSIAALSSWLEVRREWLEYGVGPKRDTPDMEQRLQPRARVDREMRMIPLLSWNAAAEYCGNKQAADLPKSSDWIACPVKISASGFALTVQGESMTNLGHGRSYPPGTIIFVDPSAKAKGGDSVIARIPNSSDLTFKILTEDAGRRFLTPLNTQYPTIYSDVEIEICGTIVGSFRGE